MDIFKLPVHPQANIFPMLAEDEMQELAADIKENGLNIPIVIGDYEGKPHIIDGRNRREACKIAKVTPETQSINGKDQTAYIASSNLNRRHMNKSQKAMARAMLYPESRGKGKRSEINSQLESGEIRYLQMARTVLRLSYDLHYAVIRGAMSVKDAYEQVKSEDQKGLLLANRLKDLREESEDLHEMVVSEKLTLEGAEAELKERKRIAKVQRNATFQNLRDSLYLSEMIFGEANQDDLVATLNKHVKEFETLATYGKKEAIKKLYRIQQNIDLFIEKMED